jgi:hypothetical protein
MMKPSENEIWAPLRKHNTLWQKRSAASEKRNAGRNLAFDGKESLV